MDKYTYNLLNNSKKLDELTNSTGVFSKNATAIVEKNDEYAVLNLLKEISNRIDKVDSHSVETVKTAKDLNTALVEYLGYLRIKAITSAKVDEEDNKGLPELLLELDSLTGLEKVKSKVRDLIAYQKIQKLRRAANLNTVRSTMHIAFTGNPGTGKTTVARIIGRIYKQLGLLSKGHFIEASRTDLIAGYQGQTALKVKKLVDKAKGGVLFIDEAYSITENEHSDSYGRECLTELTKALEDYRDDLVVIVAGYTIPMKKFFDSNPGLKSRFNSFIEFDDYDPQQLMEILKHICKANDYRIASDLQIILENYFICQVNHKDENFSNGRLARNIFDDLVLCHARRLSNWDNITYDDLATIEKEDFQIN